MDAVLDDLLQNPLDPSTVTLGGIKRKRELTLAEKALFGGHKEVSIHLSFSHFPCIQLLFFNRNKWYISNIIM
jgi:hypothetical protein